MKRNTPSHPKTTALMADLKLPRFSAVGLLEMLWHFTAHFAIRGDIGRHSDAAIAEAVGWDQSPAALTAALLNRRWLDPCPCHRMRVHDWPQHADQQTARAVVRNGGWLPCYPSSYPDKGAELAAVASAVAVPLPSLALPEPGPARGADNGALADYVREVQAAFLQKTGRPETQELESVEFAVVRRWHDEGVPLRVVLQALSETKGVGRRLMYYAGPVEDEVKRWRRAL